MCLHCCTIAILAGVPFLPIIAKEWGRIVEWTGTPFTWGGYWGNKGVGWYLDPVTPLTDTENRCAMALIPVLFGAAVVFGVTG